MFEKANFVEGCLWIVIGLCFLVSAIWRRQRRAKLIAFVNFIAFGLSDFVEMGTGAWWRPWWLLVWKAACVVVMFVQFVRYVRAGKRRGA